MKQDINRGMDALWRYVRSLGRLPNEERTDEMKCPECGVWTIVHETRKSPTFGYKRRRECANGHKFTTKEVVIPESELEQERRDHLETNRELLVAFRESGRENSGAYAPRKTAR